MSRRMVLAAFVLVLALVTVSAAPAKKPQPPSPPPPPPGGGPTAPTNLRITASSDTTISLAWDAANGGGASNWWYCVVRNGEGCLRVDPPQTTLSLSRLWPDRTTTYTVVALDSNGHRSAPSNSVTHTTPPDTTPPNPPPVLTSQAVYPTRITVSWTASIDNLTQTWYTLIMDGAVTDSFVTPWTIFYVEPSTTHTFKVTARDYFGNTVESNELVVTTPPKTDNVAPTAPTNLRFSSETNPPELWLRWDPSTDDSDSPGLILYETYVNGVLVPDGIVGGTSTIVYCRDVGPTTVVLRAVDTSGNRSGPSNELTITC
jgi:Fibronectin type III domain